MAVNMCCACGVLLLASAFAFCTNSAVAGCLRLNAVPCHGPYVSICVQTVGKGILPICMGAADRGCRAQNSEADQVQAVSGGRGPDT